MNVRALLQLGCIVCLCVFPALAGNINVTFVKAEVPPVPTEVPLDFQMNNTDDVLFLKFKIHDFSTIATIDSFIINIFLYDDGDRGDETGRILFALPGPNLPLAVFGPNLNGFTQSDPLKIKLDLCPCEIAAILPSLEDDHFRIRIVRESGDFFVADGNAKIEATLVPEPSSIYSVAGGLFAVGGWLGIRRFRSIRLRD